MRNRYSLANHLALRMQPPSQGKIENMGLVIRPSTIHAAGCYATTSMAKGTYIVEYTGPRLTVDEANERYFEQEETYLFGLEEGQYVIDGFGDAAFINHSCDPNCETVEWQERVWIVALRDIAVGEELTYDYSLYDGAEQDPSLCSCGARNCRGTLYSEKELARRAAVRTEDGSPLSCVRSIAQQHASIDHC